MSPFVPPPSAAAQQLVVTAASGSFTLGFLSETTAAIPLPTTAAAVQTALENLPLIGTGNVQVIGQGTWASPFYISFTGDMAGQNLPPLTLTSTASVANTVVTSYNADSQISTIGDNYSDYAYGYDGQGNVATVNNAGTPAVPDVVLTSGYDGMGNRTSLAASIGGVKDFINNYSYDNLSRLYDVIQQSQTGGNAVAPKQVYYQLDPIGDVTEIDRSTSTVVAPNPNGFADSILSYWPTTGQLKEINHESGGVSLDDLTYTYDGVGRVQTFGSIDGTATYAYDPMSQLKSATYTTASGGHQPANESFNFDSNGNRPAENGTTTTDNEVVDDGTFHYTFDGAGNRLTRTRDSSAPANDYEVSYTWDAANRLVEVQNFNNSGTLTEQINYTYDVFDHLIERIDAIAGGATTTTHYIWDDAASSGDGNQIDGGIVLALNGAGNVINRYLNGPNTSAYDQFFSTLAEENDAVSPAVVTWDLLDAEGSLRDVVSSTGAVLDHLNYNSFGNITYESSPTVSHIDGYAGGLYDPSTGLVYYLHRWYDPKATVWISADPAGFAAGDVDLTRYVLNAAVNLTDPSGLFGVKRLSFNDKIKDTNPGGKGNHVGSKYEFQFEDFDFLGVMLQRVTAKGRLVIIDTSGGQSTFSFDESYLEAWSFPGKEPRFAGQVVRQTVLDNHQFGTPSIANFLADIGGFKFSKPGGRPTMKHNSGGTKCGIASYDFELTVVFELTRIQDPGINFSFGKASGSHTWSERRTVNACGRGVIPGKENKTLGKYLFPGGQDNMPPFPQPNPANVNDSILTDTDTLRIHWDAGDKEPDVKYKTSGYK